MTWYLEDKSIWAAAMAMSLAMLHVNKSLSLKQISIDYRAVFCVCLLQVINAVLAIVLQQALRREEKVMYRRN